MLTFFGKLLLRKNLSCSSFRTTGASVGSPIHSRNEFLPLRVIVYTSLLYISRIRLGHSCCSLSPSRPVLRFTWVRTMGLDFRIAHEDKDK